MRARDEEASGKESEKGGGKKRQQGKGMMKEPAEEG